MGRDVVCQAGSDWGYPIQYQMVWAVPFWGTPSALVPTCAKVASCEVDMSKQDGALAVFTQETIGAMACVPVAGASEEPRAVFSMQAAVPATPCTLDDCQPQEQTVVANPRTATHKRGGRRRPRRASTSQEAEAVLIAKQQSTEVLPGCDDLAVAVFTDLMSRLEAAEAREEAFATLRAAFASLAFDSQGCRVAQALLDATGRQEHAELAAELHGRVREALASPHANFVLQKMVEIMPPRMVAFVVEELVGVAVSTAQHRFACRGICRLLEHCPFEMTKVLVDEILAEAPALCRHTYGNYVIQLILEHGSLEQKRAIVQAVLQDPLDLASHRTGSSVVEHALANSDVEDRQKLLHALLRDQTSFAALACCRYGSFVARALVCLPGIEATEARVFATAMMPQLQNNKYGMRVLAGLSGA